MVGDPAWFEASVLASERTQLLLDAVWQSALENRDQMKTRGRVEVPGYRRHPTYPGGIAALTTQARIVTASTPPAHSKTNQPSLFHSG